MISNSLFVRNVATLVSGQGFALALPILAAPIQSRLYTPADYGILGTFMAVSTLFSMAANWQYAQAVTVQTSERKALVMFAVATWASLSSCVISIVVVPFIVGFVEHKLQLWQISSWLWLVPLTTFTSGVCGAINALANRRKDYKFMAWVTAISATAPAIISITLGWLGAGLHGLLLSYISGQIISFLVYSFRYKWAYSAFVKVSFPKIVAMARRNASFPIYALPASLLRNLALSVPNFSLVSVGAADVAGNFSRGQSLLALPINLMGTAIAQVFRQAAVDERVIKGNCWAIYIRTLIYLSIGAPIIVSFIAFYAPEAFVLYLGEQWRETGTIARILAPMMALRMIAGPLWPIFSIFHANNYDLRYTAVQLAAICLLITPMVVFSLPPIWQLYAFVLVTSSESLVNIFRTYRIVKYNYEDSV